MGDVVRKRRGVAVFWAVMSLPILFAMAALAIDVGYICTSQAEMQNAVDSGALAGASALPIGNAAARARAMDYAGKNDIGTEAVVVNAEDVEIGNWKWDTQTFTPVSDDDAGRRPNAVRVVGRKDPLPLFFAAAFGFAESLVQRDAIALADAGRCRGVWGLTGVTGSGDIITDSYNSQDGPYGTGNINQNGDVCSCEDVRLSGSLEIHGDVGYGAGYDVDLLGNPTVAGDQIPVSCDFEVPTGDIDTARLTNDNDTIGLLDDGRDPLIGDGLRLTEDDNLTLAPGTYYFSWVRMSGQATITITGPTTIYVEGDAKFTGGGLVNVTEDPANLTIYATGPSLDLAGGSGFHGAVIAPETDVTLVGDSEYFGDIIGQTLTVRGTAEIHVDERVVSDIMGGDNIVIPVLVE